MKVSLGNLDKDLQLLEKALKQWKAMGVKNLEKVFRRYGLYWQAEAKKRVPVDEGRLEKGIIAPPPYMDGDKLTMEVGTNIEYGPYIEFGTTRIAGGKVLALGDGPGITDQQAIKSWPAKDAEALSGSTEQMPFLRPAFNEIREDLIDEIDEAFEPPRKGEG